MKILLIEDDKFFQKFYSSKFTEEEYEVQTASNGAEGIEKALAFKPDVIVLDLIMPIKNGFEFLESRKNNPTLASIPVLVFSTLGQESDIQRALSLGAVDYINKSLFDFESVKAKIEKMK